MKRRSFLTACIATLSAPMIVRAQSLMPVRPICSVYGYVRMHPRILAAQWIEEVSSIGVGSIDGPPCTEYSYSADIEIELPSAVDVRRVWLGNHLIHDNGWIRPETDGRLSLRIPCTGLVFPDRSVNIEVRSLMPA